MAVGLDEGIELLDRLARLVFLIVGKTDGDHNHESHNGGGGGIAGGQRDDGDDQKLDNQRVLAPHQDLHDEAVLLFLTEIVGPPLLAECLHFGSVQPLLAALHQEQRVVGLPAADLQEPLLVFGDRFRGLLLRLGKAGRGDFSEEILGHGRHLLCQFRQGSGKPQLPRAGIIEKSSPCRALTKKGFPVFSLSDGKGAFGENFPVLLSTKPNHLDLRYEESFSSAVAPTVSRNHAFHRDTDNPTIPYRACRGIPPMPFHPRRERFSIGQSASCPRR